MYQWMKKYLDPICPLFAILPLLSCFGLNMLVYSGTMVMCADWYHYDLTTSLDQAIPLVPGWMYIYFGCFLFWTVNYIMVARINRNDPDTFYRFVAADMISRLVCGIIFMVFPTTNVRPEVTGTGFSVFLLQFLYGLDQPTNLFPSIHCLVSWFCYTGTVHFPASLLCWLSFQHSSPNSIILPMPLPVSCSQKFFHFSHAELAGIAHQS